MVTAHLYLDHALGWPENMVPVLLDAVVAELGWAPVLNADWWEDGRLRTMNWRKPTKEAVRRLSEAMRATESFYEGSIYDALPGWSPNQRMGMTGSLRWRISRSYVDREREIPLRLSVHLESRETPTSLEVEAIPRWFLHVATVLGSSYGVIGTFRDKLASQRDIEGGPVSFVGRVKTDEEIQHELDVMWQRYLPNRLLWGTKARAAYWANLLTPIMVEQLGGVELVTRDAPVDHVEALSGGRIYLQLTATIPEPGNPFYGRRLETLKTWLEPILLPPISPEWAEQHAGVVREPPS